MPALRPRGAVPFELVLGGTGVVVYAVAQSLAADNPVGWIISGAVLLGIWARIEWGNKDLRHEIQDTRRDIATLRELVGKDPVSKQISEAMSKVASRAQELTTTIQHRMDERAAIVDRRFERLDEDIRELRRSP